MSFLSDQRARNLARKDSRLWAAGAGGRTGLAAPIGSGVRQGGGGRPSLDGQTVVAADPVYLAAGDAQAAADAAQAVADDAALTGAAAQVAADEAATAADGAQAVADSATFAANNIGPTQITDNAIETQHLLAGAVVAGKIAAGAITAGSAIIATAAIGSAQIASLTASKLTAGTIDANVITVANLNASNITTGSLSANLISGGTISGVSFEAGISITSPTITGGIVRTSSFGARTQLSGNGLQFYDSNSNKIGSIEPYGSSLRDMRISATDGPAGDVIMRGHNVILQSINTDSFWMNGYLALNEYNHDHNTGTRTTNDSLSWLGVYYGPNGISGSSDGTVGQHTHAVPYHTHQVVV